MSRYVRLQKKGTSYAGLCPFHNEKTPSFSVSADRQIFHCFGCGAGGNVISFVMRIENFGFIDALKNLADNIHYTLPESGDEKSLKESREQREILMDIHKRAARFFFDALSSKEGTIAADYLDKRGVSPPVRRKYGLGYSPAKGNKLYDFLANQGFSDDILVKSGLIGQTDGRIYDKFFGRLMFPIFDARGNVIAFGGRVLDDGKKTAKYLNSPETPLFIKNKTLYSLNLAAKERNNYIILAEGYMDVISLYQYGFRSAVAALGTAFGENHAHIIEKMCQTIILLFDSDEAGQKAAVRAIDILRGSTLDVRVLTLEGAKDPDEFLKTYGAQAFAEMLQKASPDTEFLIRSAKSRYDLSNPDGKIKFAAETAQILAKIDDYAERDVYGKEAAKIADIDENAIKNEVEKRVKSVKISEEARARRATLTETTAQNGQNGVSRGIDGARRFILRLYADRSAYDAVIERNIEADEFCVPAYIKLFAAVKNAKQANAPVQPSKIIDFFETEQERQTIASVFLTETFCEDEPKQLSDSIRAVKISFCQYMKTMCANDLEKANVYVKKVKELEGQTFL